MVAKLEKAETFENAPDYIKNFHPIVLIIMIFSSVLQTDGTIIHVKSGKCLDVTDQKNSGYVVIKDCDKSDTQKWTFQHYLT